MRSCAVAQIDIDAYFAVLILTFMSGDDYFAMRESFKFYFNITSFPFMYAGELWSPRNTNWCCCYGGRQTSHLRYNTSRSVDRHLLPIKHLLQQNK